MVSTRQVKAARAMLAWSQENLAEQSGVSYPTIARLEADDGPLRGRADTATKIVSALEGAGVIFVEENGGGPGVRLRKGSGRSTIHPEPIGPAADAVEATDAATEEHRSKRKR